MSDASHKMKKDQVRARVVQAVIAAEVAKGNLKWKVSDIARFTKVSRPLIYYHFGKTKKDILSECLNVIAEDYYGLTPERSESLEPKIMLDSLLRTRNMFVKNPALVVFYQRERMKDSAAGRQLVEIEKRFQKKLKTQFPKTSEEIIKGLHALFHGIISAPFLDEESFKAALSLINFQSVGARK